MGRVTAELEAELLAALARVNAQAVNTALAFETLDAAGTRIGGVAGSTSYGWLLVKILWVHDAYQGQGIARDLMARIETQAKSLGCHGAWLDTSNPAARAVYDRLGYQTFGTLANAPTDALPDHKRWFLKRRL